MPTGQPVHVLSDIDTDARTATCRNCGPVPITRRTRQRGRVGWACAIAKRRHRGRRVRVSRYGITHDDWHALLIAQSGRCAICTTPLRRPYVDHDHATGIVRGLLCNGCNLAVGMFRDDPARLAAAIAYLTRP